MRNLSFTVDAWSAWSTTRTQAADWLAWANSKAPASCGSQPDVSMVPAMQRRRMSSLSKMAFATAYSCSVKTQVLPNCIFASQHGELTRTVKILDAITDYRDLSPTDFSLSVHNTALGLFSIFTGNKLPASTVVAGADTFGSALIEAVIYLNRFPGTPALLVFFDEPLPAPLTEFAEPTNEAFAIALLLSLPAAGAKGLNVSYQPNANQLPGRENLGMQFLKFYLSGSDSNEYTTQRLVWRWSR